MPTARQLPPTFDVARARDVLRRGWYWGADYRWVTKAIVGGLVRPGLPPGYSQGWRRPVLLVPGVIEDWTMMRLIGDRLNQAGHPVHRLPDLRRNTMTVVEGSEVTAAYLADHDLRDVVIVAHSKGGLIAKHFMLGDTEGRVRQLIAIATPFSGSVLARLVPWQLVRSLGPDDPTITELAGQAAVNHKITSVSPAFDPHIPGGSHLDGAVNVPVAAMGHFRVLAQPEVLDAVVAAAAR